MLNMPKLEYAEKADVEMSLTIETSSDADSALLEFARQKRSCAKLQAAFDAEVEALYLKYAELYAGHQAKMKAYEEAIVAWAKRALAEMNASTLKPRKSLGLTFGIVRFTREGDRVVINVDSNQLFRNLRVNRLARLIRRKEYVDAADLRTVDVKLHAKLGFAIEPTPSTGRIELDESKLRTLTEFRVVAVDDDLNERTFSEVRNF